MKCPICNAKTKVSHTFAVDARAAKTVERVCENGHKLTFVTVFVGAAKGRGNGAYALAQRLKRGEKLNVEEDAN